MSSRDDRIDDAIDSAARALVTPPPDDRLVSRLVAGLPARAHVGFIWPGLAAAVLTGLAIWWTIDRPPESESLAGRVPVIVSPPLVAIHPGVTAEAPGVARASGLGGRTSTGEPGQRLEDHNWGLPRATTPSALTLGELGTEAIAPGAMDLAPIEIGALSMSASLDSLRE